MSNHGRGGNSSYRMHSTWRVPMSQRRAVRVNLHTPTSIPECWGVYCVCGWSESHGSFASAHVSGSAHCCEAVRWRETDRRLWVARMDGDREVRALAAKVERYQHPLHPIEGMEDGGLRDLGTVDEFVKGFPNEVVTYRVASDNARGMALDSPLAASLPTVADLVKAGRERRDRYQGQVMDLVEGLRKSWLMDGRSMDQDHIVEC